MRLVTFGSPTSTGDDATVATATRAVALVADRQGETTTSAGTMLVIAYLLMWLLVFTFVWTSFRRILRLDARLRELERAQARRLADPGGREET